MLGRTEMPQGGLGKSSSNRDQTALSGQGPGLTLGRRGRNAFFWFGGVSSSLYACVHSLAPIYKLEQLVADSMLLGGRSTIRRAS